MKEKELLLKGRNLICMVLSGLEDLEGLRVRLQDFVDQVDGLLGFVKGEKDHG